MPIDRTAFDALVDDDGTNTIGTPWDKAAIEAVLLDPIDAALGSAGTVTHASGALTATRLVVGNGSDDVDVIASSGTTTTVLHGNAAGDPTFGAVALATDVSGVLPPANGGVSAATVALTDGATPALNAALGTVFRLAAAGDRTIAVPSNPTAGQKIVIQHYASGGARTLALNSGAGGFRFGSDITALTQTASGKTDYIGAIYNDTDSMWDVVAVTKGF